MAWIQTHLTLNKTDAAFAELLLETLGAVSVTLTDAGDEPQLEPAPGEEKIWSQTVVTGLFDASTDMQQLRDALELATGSQRIDVDIAIETLEDQPWERAWMENFRPMQFGTRLWVVPHGQAVPEDAVDPVIMTLDPGLAFGTGTHPTTALCLTWLEQAAVAGKTVIDYGCGSGILAIAALLLGAENAIGIDHDPQALTASGQNAQDNGVAEHLQLQGIDVPPPAEADLVIANILASVLVELSGQLTALVKPGGRIVMSGILAEQADMVREAYSAAFALDPVQQQEDWVLISGTRR